MKKFIGYAAGLLAVALFTIAGSPLVLAQVPSVSGPYNSPQTQVIALTSQAAGTVNGALSTNLASLGIVCTFDQSAHTGTPSTTFSVQGYDPVSNTFATLATSGAITADNTPATVFIYPAIQTSSLPAGVTGIGVHVPRQYRISTTVGGTSPVVTATISCGLLR